MDEQDNNKIYAIPVDYIYDIWDESIQQIDVTKDFLSDILERIGINEDVLFHMSEILYANLAIARLAETEVEYAARRANPETDDEEYILSSEVMQTLQTLLLSRYYANVNLNKISYSISLH